MLNVSTRFVSWLEAQRGDLSHLEALTEGVLVSSYGLTSCFFPQ